MRHYVLCNSPLPEVAPYIIAEVVSDGLDDDPRNSLAAGLAGERALIATRRELLGDTEWKMALAAWEARDDSDFDLETQVLLADDSDTLSRPLHVVDSSERRVSASGRIPNDAARREVVLRARALRIWSRALVQETRLCHREFLAAKAGFDGSRAGMKRRPNLEVVASE
ncbi:MAG: hypothetical protein WD826_05380 [Actinomycetota bacterium]